jgi:hypothetical protein
MAVRPSIWLIFGAFQHCGGTGWLNALPLTTLIKVPRTSQTGVFSAITVCFLRRDVA